MAQFPSRAPSTASQRPPMPHVSTLYQSADLKNFDARKLLSSQRSQRKSNDIYRSNPSSPRKKGFGDAKSSPNLHLLATPENTESNFSPVQHRRHNSSEGYSASSGGDSVFELPTVAFESPNSSTNTSFVAELEDTSALGFMPSPPTIHRVPSTTDTSMLFKSNKFTSRAIIKVVDETIAAIEASNKELLARAEAAEATTYRLREANTHLQIELDEAKNSYRPKTAPPVQCTATQTSPRHTPHSSIDRNGSPTPLIPPSNTPLSCFNKDQDTPTDPKRKKSIRNLKFLQRHHAEAFTQPLTPPPHDLKHQHRASTDRPRTADASAAPKRPPPPPPVPELPNNMKKHTRTLSLEEAKRISASKPLPPLGPMSPSVIQGVVEIGLGIQEGDEGKEKKTLRNRKSWVRFRSKEVSTGELVEDRKREKKKKRNGGRKTDFKADFRFLKWGKKEVAGKEGVV